MRALVGAFAFAAEVLLVVATWRSAASGFDGLGGAAAGVVAAALLVAVWGRWCAPRSRHRLADPALAVLQVLLFVGGGAAALLTGATLLGVAVLVGTLSVPAVRIVDPHGTPTGERARRRR